MSLCINLLIKICNDLNHDRVITKCIEMKTYEIICLFAWNFNIKSLDTCEHEH